MAQYAKISDIKNNKEKLQSFREVPEISSSQHKLDIINSNKKLVVYNYANWCAPCKECASQVNQLSEQHSQFGIVFVKENVDHNFQRHGEIEVVPCFHFYKNGQFQSQMTLNGMDEFEMSTALNSLRD
jgi:thiol-disulfide isomerase/thioredoxin